MTAPKQAPAPLGELRMNAAEFDRLMRHAVQAPPPVATPKKKAEPKKRPAKRSGKK